MFDGSKYKPIEREQELRQELRNIALYFSVGLSIYFLCLAVINLQLLHGIEKAETIRWFGISYAVGLLLLMMCVLFKSSLPISCYGLTLSDARKSVTEALVCTAAVTLILILIKIYIFHVERVDADLSLFNIQAIDLFFWTYPLVAFVQEFFMRGVLQTGVECMLNVKKHRVSWSILITAIFFGMCHILYSVAFAIVAFLASCLWGWLYARHRTLIGVVISHLILGYVFILLDFWEYIAFK